MTIYLRHLNVRVVARLQLRTCQAVQQLLMFIQGVTWFGPPLYIACPSANLRNQWTASLNASSPWLVLEPCCRRGTHSHTHTHTYVGQVQVMVQCSAICCQLGHFRQLNPVICREANKLNCLIRPIRFDICDVFIFCNVSRLDNFKPNNLNVAYWT